MMHIHQAYAFYGPILLFVWSVNSLGRDGCNRSARIDASTLTVDEELEKWVAMWNVYDLSMVDSLFITDDRLTYFSSEREGLITGIAAVREHHKGFGFVPGGKIQENRLWLENIHTEIWGDVVILGATWFFQTVSGESPGTSSGPVTFVYIQTERGYRIIHTHFANYES